MASVALSDCTKGIGKLKSTCHLPTTISFSKNIQPIFNSSCAISACHVGAIPSGKLNLEALNAYTNLMKSGKGYIDTVNYNY
ncbi:MAG: hypothetical protein WCR21_08160, partial [Bacteroidota bacterium]